MADAEARCGCRPRAAPCRASPATACDAGGAIPYARPPVGPLRLRAPQPAAPWRGVRHCDEFANCAPQQRRYTAASGLASAPADERGLPDAQRGHPGHRHRRAAAGDVLHPRRRLHLRQFGDPDLRRAALARRGCVYVSANYRLGALGCLDLSSLSTRRAPDRRQSVPARPGDGAASGCATTSRCSAATPTTSRSSARAPARTPSPRCSRCPPHGGCSTRRSRRARRADWSGRADVAGAVRRTVRPPTRCGRRCGARR